MKNHYTPASFEIVQRFYFNSRFCRSGESVSTYIAELRAPAEFCNFGETLNFMIRGNFGETLNLMIRNKLVCGINNDNTKRLLLAEKELTYKKVLEVKKPQLKMCKLFVECGRRFMMVHQLLMALPWSQQLSLVTTT